MASKITKLRCFVASAFGRKDVDGVFARLIEPTLRSMSIDVFRVDRVVHNDDVDDKILELLKSADICIADLTYARPSVYFEAGYAMPLNKPVIFVARRDHFRARDTDPEGR